MVAHRPAAAGRTAALRIATRIGPEIGLSRAELGLPIETVARRANVAPSTVLRVIAGDPGVHLDTLCAVAMAVGLSVSAKAYPAAPPSLRDTGQMSMAGHLIALAHSSRRPNLEHPVGDPYGRAADLVFFGPEDILDFELERHVVDFQAQHRKGQGEGGSAARPP